MGSDVEIRRPWDIQKAVITALFLREMKTRFGVYNLGYFWAILEPAAVIIVFWAMFGLRMRKHLPGIDYPMFLMTGMVSWRLFASLVSRSLPAMKSNQGLFIYRQVKPIDSLISRMLVECLVYFFVFISFVAAGYFLGYDIRVANIPALIASFAGVILFGFFVGLGGSLASYYSDTIPRVINLCMRPMFYSSGIFFVVATVPDKFRWMLLLNPMLQWNELVRASYFATYSADLVNPLYIGAWLLGSSYASLWFYMKLKEKIIAS
ncbi:ABC transporter permease [Desulfoluna spongiiphila]|uniref:ABC transporter permease n=1 Tax=Desulfoluna spongiiphila TaxID=419481 RepID=UPI001254BFFD|nr:ABC transporter permease [Desulfoluna spongiiphila]VVS92366.1 abc-2 transporter [Desulfoluna spongiiphila]